MIFVCIVTLNILLMSIVEAEPVVKAEGRLRVGG